MYSRPQDEQGNPTTFGVSGKLWNGVMVMYDRDTLSLWTQLDGRAIEGERLGDILEHKHSVQTTWAAWKAAHPDTLVLEKTGDDLERTGSVYADYFADPDALFLPELGEGLSVVGPNSVVFGLGVDGGWLAVTEPLLRLDGVINTLAGSVPIVLIRDHETGAVTAHRRLIDGRLVLLERSSRSGGLRDTLAERAIDPDTLTRVRVDRAFWYAWKRMHPKTLLLSN